VGNEDGSSPDFSPRHHTAAADALPKPANETVVSADVEQQQTTYNGVPPSSDKSLTAGLYTPSRIGNDSLTHSLTEAESSSRTPRATTPSDSSCMPVAGNEGSTSTKEEEANLTPEAADIPFPHGRDSELDVVAPPEPAPSATPVHHGNAGGEDSTSEREGRGEGLSSWTEKTDAEQHAVGEDWTEDSSCHTLANGSSSHPDFTSATFLPGGLEQPRDDDKEAMVASHTVTESPHMVNGESASEKLANGTSSLSRSQHGPALPTVSEYLLQLASTKEWADWDIQVNPPGLQPFICPAHRLILLRSPWLQGLMTRQQPDSHYPRNVTNLFPARHVLPEAFEAALRFLYSDSVLSSDGLFPRSPPTDIQPARGPLLDYIVSYWVAGIELGLEPVSSRAEQLLTDFLDWDVAELAVTEATALSSLAALTPARKHMNEDDYVAAGASIMKAVLHFLSTHLHLNSFRLDVTSCSTILPPRLPPLDDNRPRPNPALASIVFGSMPSSATAPPTSPRSEIVTTSSSLENTVASHIFLNLDFANLASLFEDLKQSHAHSAAQLMAQVVNERENRRLKTWSNRAVSNKHRMANSALWDVVGLKESWRDNRLQQERVGFLLPPK